MKRIKKLSYKSRREASVVDSCPDCIAHDVTIGTQTWTGCNATVSTYRDGTTIPYVSDPTIWESLTTGAWCYYNNDPSTEATYGKLYNWYAATDTLHGGIAPVGYHMPTDIEWTTLTDYLGGLSIAGGKLKELGTCHWISPNTGATNSSGFSALPGGQRNNTNYDGIGYNGYWWTSTEYSTDYAWYNYLSTSSDSSAVNLNSKKWGLSIRFIKDEVACLDITIGTQTWTSCNLNVDTYRNGDPIPQVTDATTWANLTTGAWCYYNNSSANGTVYGKLYNKYALDDPRGLAPLGYHIPTDTEWNTLITYLGGTSVAGGKMKEVGTLHWQSPNTGATNITGFSALPGGFRGAGGGFGYINQFGHYRNTINANALAYNTQTIIPAVNTSSYGYSVRLIKDIIPTCPDVTIGTQTWTGCNLNVATYKDGTPIPYVSDPTIWASLTTGAWCWYNNDPINGPIYGKLYNWYAVNDPRGLAPDGYHIPTHTEWLTLTTTVGGYNSFDLRETGTSHWASPNTGTNLYGYTALPGGVREDTGVYGSLTNNAFWWSATSSTTNNSWCIGMSNSGNTFGNLQYDKNSGQSVRLIKD